MARPVPTAAMAILALLWNVGAATGADEKVWRVGILGVMQRPSEGALREAMRDLGYVEGRNVVYDARYPGRRDLLGAAVAAMLDGKADVIVAAGVPAAEAAKQGTATVPIVLWGTGDPVATGLVVNVSHPEANITGVTE